MRVEIELKCPNCQTVDSVEEGMSTNPECSGGCGARMEPTGKQMLSPIHIWMTRENGRTGMDVWFDGKKTGIVTLGEMLETIVGIWQTVNPGFTPGLNYLQGDEYWERHRQAIENPPSQSELDAEFEVKK